MSAVQIFDLGAHFAEQAGSASVARERLTGPTCSWDDKYIPPLEQIVPHPGLRAQHPLGHLLDPRYPLRHDDILSIIRNTKVDLSITALGPGTIPASTNPQSSYSRHSWTRDTALVACALKWTGYNEAARAVVENLGMFYGAEPQRSHIVWYHFNPDPEGKYHQLHEVPLVRIPIDTSGALRFEKSAEAWSHAQLDALSMWLWTTFRFANQEVIDLPDLNRRISCINPHNESESIFVAAIKMLHCIHYWAQDDFGPWEEQRGLKRATSVGISVAALLEARKFFEQHGTECLPALNLSEQAKLPDLLATMIDHGRTTLAQRIPNELDAFAIETDTPGVPSRDAGLSILLYPFEVGLTERQETAILRTVYSLMGEVGFKRYRGDPYVGSDYIHRGDPHLMADQHKPGFREAEWCLFDATLAAYYFRRFANSDGRDVLSFRYGEQHLKRALSHITARPTTYDLTYDNTRVKIPAGSCPEAYFFDSQWAASRAVPWRPNSNTPLNWTKAALALALERGLLAFQMYESRYR